MGEIQKNKDRKKEDGWRREERKEIRKEGRKEGRIIIYSIYPEKYFRNNYRVDTWTHFLNEKLTCKIPSYQTVISIVEEKLSQNRKWHYIQKNKLINSLSEHLGLKRKREWRSGLGAGHPLEVAEVWGDRVCPNIFKDTDQIWVN